MRRAMRGDDFAGFHRVCSRNLPNLTGYTCCRRRRRCFCCCWCSMPPTLTARLLLFV